MSKTICLDFDGVIHKYSRHYQGTIYDPPIEGTKKALIRMLKKGYKLVIHTAYPKPDEIPAWMIKYFGKTIAKQIKVIGGKPKAFMYIDDRAIRFINWKDILSYLP